MKEIEVESVDQLRIEEEAQLGEVFEKYWLYLEFTIVSMNLIMLIFTLAVHFSLLREFLGFMICMCCFLSLKPISYTLTEIIWYFFRFIWWIFRCKRDHISHNSSLLYKAIGYFVKKIALLLIMGYSLFNLKRYFDTDNQLIKQDCIV